MKKHGKLSPESTRRQTAALGLIALLIISSVLPAAAQKRASIVKKTNAGSVKFSNKELERTEKRLEKQREREIKVLDKINADLYPDGERTGEKILVEKADEKTVVQIMAEQSALESQPTARETLMEKGILPEKEGPDRRNLPQNPNALPISQYPFDGKKLKSAPNLVPTAPQIIGLNFNGVTGPTETGAFPPDTQGAVGPTQFVVFVNGRLRTFNKTTGAADGVINANTDVFFASVMTPAGAGEVTFTTDPNVRFDRLSGRWILNIIDVTVNATTGATTKANRVIIAVSNTSTITAGTVWSFYQFTGDAALFTDYQSFGVDADAMYIGGNMFTLAGAFSSTKGFVIPKAPVISGSTMTVWAFSGLVATSTGAGPFSPRGVDNVDPANTGPAATGYFIGVDNATFSTLMLRRITNPGSTSASPTISANISITVPTTTTTAPVTHLGNTGGNNGRLDALDDRLYSAVIRNGRLWTAHNFRVSFSGIANTAAQARNGVRWYELQNLNTTPSLVQSGTIYDNAPTLAAAQQYWIPSIAVSGQGHAAIGSSIAGTNFRANAFTTGRLAGDALGTMRDGPGAAAGYTATTFDYNPASDPGGGGGRRWGDYSLTSLDPLDDMTMWTIQQYTSGANTYGTRVAQLKAPPPASIADGPNSGLYNVSSGLSSVNVTITGTSVGGSGFFDPGANLPAPAVPFNHISASISGTNVTVNSVTYNSPTSITLNLSTVGATLTDSNLSPATLRNLTVTNPDGQSVTRTGIINITAPSAAGADIRGSVVSANGTPVRGANISLVDTTAGGVISTTSRADGSYLFQNIRVGSHYAISANKNGFEFEPAVRSLNLVENVSGENFNGAPDAAHARTSFNDFDGDGISDYAVFRPNQNVWYILQSATGTMRAESFGLASDVSVAADYDGDGKTDIAVWRPADGTWYVKQSSNGAVVAHAFGSSGDVPVYGYFDDDAKTDLAIFRPASATWWIQSSATNAVRSFKWGLSTDKPAPQDYDGDGKTDIAVFRPSNGTWYVVNSSTADYSIKQFGMNGDQPVFGDFDGDGKADLVVFRSSEQNWYALESASAAFKTFRFGSSGDWLIGGDYDGDGKSDAAVFRDTDSNWYVKTSLDQSFAAVRWGKTGDLPILPPAMK